MNIRVFWALVLAFGMSISNSASAYTKVFWIDFPSQTARSVVTSTSPGTEYLLYDKISTHSEIWEAGNFVRDDPCTSPTRVGQQSVSCTSIAVDFSLTVGCSYCNHGPVAYDDDSYIRAYDGIFYEEVGTSTSSEYYRCEIPPEPD